MISKYKTIYKQMLEDAMSADSGGPLGDYAVDTGAPASDVENQAGYGGGPTADARMPTGNKKKKKKSGKPKKEKS